MFGEVRSRMTLKHLTQLDYWKDSLQRNLYTGTGIIREKITADTKTIFVKKLKNSFRKITLL